MPVEKTAEDYGREGMDLRRLGRREEAVAALQKGLKTTPSPPWLHAVLGEVFREMGSRVRGYAEIQQAIRQDPSGAGAGEFPGGAESREDAWVHALRGGAKRTKGDLSGAEKDLLKALDLDAGCGWAWGWLGELYLRQGGLPRALTSLDRAIALFAEWSEAFAWRGEAKRLLGRNEEAVKDLDHAIALGLRQYDVYVSRGSVRQALGDAEGQVKDLTEAVRLAPEVFKGKARELEDEAGAAWIERTLAEIKKAEALFAKAERAFEAERWAEALLVLEECLKTDPGNVKAALALADAHERLGRLEEAMKDAEVAVRIEPSSETYAKRADVAQKAGYMEAALRDTSLAVAMAPSVALYQWRGRTFLGMRHYDLALKDISSALELDPDNAALYDLRAHVNLILGRLLTAQEDVEKALTIVPGEVNLHLRRGQLLALQKRFEEAHRSIDPIREKHPAWAHFIAGYVHCVEKRYAEAGPAFDQAVALATEEDGNLKFQANFYGTVAKAVGAKTDGEGTMPTKEKQEKRDAALKDKGRVYLCGLGVYPPQTATVEVLRGISECDVVFNNLPGVGISEFLGLFCANRRPVAFRYEQDAKLCADLVLSEVRPGRTVGFITFGHPLLFGPLSHEIIQRCKKEGIPCKAFGAVSSMDAVLAASGQVLGYAYGGFQLFETTGAKILDEIAVANPRLPLVVYFADGMGEQWLAQLVKTLKKSYPQGHRCLLYGPKHELWETTQEGIALKDLGKISHHKLAQGILFVPPRPAK